MDEPKAHLFWDNSNIFISAQGVVESREPQAFPGALRIHFSNLLQLALAGRGQGQAVVVGSENTANQKSIWRKLEEETGIEIQLFEPGQVSGKEQGVDQVLQTHMLRAGIDNRDDPQIAVLLTGDGAGADDGVGFHADMKRLYDMGWGVEVLAWDISCNTQLKEWAQEVGVYVCLEDYYDSVTFMDGGRSVRSLHLTNRKKAETHPSEAMLEIAVLEEKIAEFEEERNSRKAYQQKMAKRKMLGRKPAKRRR